jgi:hypothetical protein
MFSDFVSVPAPSGTSWAQIELLHPGRVVITLVIANSAHTAAIPACMVHLIGKSQNLGPLRWEFELPLPPVGQ